jgi:UDP-N-acetylmuramate dehydrogenase
MSSKHFTLVAERGATADAFAAATSTVAATVLDSTGVHLTPEPDLIGDVPAYRELQLRARHTSGQPLAEAARL